MNSGVIELLVLAGIAVFLILRLRSALGTRDGFEPPMERVATESADRDFQVIEGGPDGDILDHAEEGSAAAQALAAMKGAEPQFSVTEFLQGARGAYEMILMAFENGSLDDVAPFLSPEVYEAFQSAVDARAAEGLLVEANFVGVRELKLADASFDPDSREAEIAVRFVGELTSVVRDQEGEIVEGNPNEIKRQKDIWSFARTMGSDDVNWTLVATGE